MRKISFLWGSLRNRLILTFAAIILITYFYSGFSLYQNLAVELPQVSLEVVSVQTRELRSLLEQYLAEGQTLDAAVQAVAATETPELRLHVYTANGQQIAGFFPLQGERDALQSALKGQEEEKILIDESGLRYTLIALPIHHRGQIIGAIITISSLSTLDRLQTIISPRLFTALIFSLVAVIGAGLYIAGYISRVLSEVEDVANEIAEGRFDQRITVSSRDEVGRLASTINHMAEELQRLSQARGQFMSKVSHELRTPLTIIKGFAKTALREKMPPDQERRLQIIDEQTDKLTHLVDDLLSLARKDAGKLELHRTEVNIAKLIVEVVESNQLRATSQDIHLHFVSSEHHDSTVWIDRHRIGEVLQNLVDNALKFTQKGGEVELKLETVADKLQITVTDTGCGIHLENLPFLFERFYKVDPRQKGTGLGLAIARELLQLHGGEISVDSQPGVGTQFRILLPQYAEIPRSAEVYKENHKLAKVLE